MGADWRRKGNGDHSWRADVNGLVLDVVWHPARWWDPATEIRWRWVVATDVGRKMVTSGYTDSLDAAKAAAESSARNLGDYV